VDDKLRQQLSDWLQFYRDLGIEEVYRRGPGGIEMPAGSAAPEAPMSGAPSAPSPGSKTPEESPSTQSKVPEKALVSPRLQEPVSIPKSMPAPGPAAQSLSLFEAPPAPRRERETLEEIRTDLGDCQRCRLAKGRKTIVFGQGNPHAELVFVGEGPGADEDEQGLPFVGRAGRLLNRMIELAGMKREGVYIANIVKCRPPGNRVPEKDEIETCSPFLYRQIEAIRPKLVCCLGAPAVKTLLGIKEGITKIRGNFYDFGSAKALATVHPAYVLRNPREEKILREDFEKIVEFLGRK
jgi:uracil-DNA glycosylase family 4